MSLPKYSLHFLYHEIRDESSRYSYVTERGQFEKHIDLFAKVREEDGTKMWPEITFDDGHSSNYTQALPVLDRRGMAATFFITAGWTGRKPGYMGWQELRALQAAGHSIGAHGWSHALLTHCDNKQLNLELTQARQALEDGLGASITTMSLPGGRYNRRVLAACQEAGYTQVYTSIPRSETVPAGFMVGRLNVRGDMTLDWIAHVLQPESGMLSSQGRQYRIKAAAKTLLGDRAYGKLWALLNRKEPDSNDSGGGGDDAE